MFDIALLMAVAMLFILVLSVVVRMMRFEERLNLLGGKIQDAMEEDIEASRKHRAEVMERNLAMAHDLVRLRDSVSRHAVGSVAWKAAVREVIDSYGDKTY